MKIFSIQAAKIGPNIPAVAPAKPMIIYSYQPVNQFRLNMRLKKKHIKVINAQTMEKANNRVRFFFITMSILRFKSNVKIVKIHDMPGKKRTNVS